MDKNTLRKFIVEIMDEELAPLVRREVKKQLKEAGLDTSASSGPKDKQMVLVRREVEQQVGLVLNNKIMPAIQQVADFVKYKTEDGSETVTSYQRSLFQGNQMASGKIPWAFE
jgi:hypothetical protein